MPYGLKYFGEFDEFKIAPVATVYRLEIWQKDYTGPNFSLELASSPVVHKWQTDEPKAPIKGSSLQISLLNPGTTLPLTSFYSTEDDGFLVRFLYGSQLLFTGYLVQDDCNETLVDYRHIINLSATDNLGLLKDIALNANPVTTILAYDSPVQISGTAPNKLTFDFGNYTPQVGVTLVISGHPSLNGTYTPLTVVENTVGHPSYTITVAGAIANTAFAAATVTVTGVMDVGAKNNLLTIIASCLYNTGLTIGTNVYSNLLETRQSVTESFLRQTWIDTTSFIVNDRDYDNCYSVLEQIMERFNLTLFQAYGVWNIVRWDELRSYAGLVPGFGYDSGMQLVGSVLMDPAFTVGFGQTTEPENGAERSITRPYSFDKETFNYKQPKYLLRNFDLQKLGALIRQYTQVSGGVTYNISEYVFTDWTIQVTAPSFQCFIRVLKDTLGNEVDRYVVMKGDVNTPQAFVSTRAVASFPIEVQAGDKAILTFSTRAPGFPAPSSGIIDFTLRDYNGIQDYVLYNHNGSTFLPKNLWHTGGPGTDGFGLAFNTTSGVNPLFWNTISMEGDDIPFNGLMTFYLSHFNYSLSTNRETHVKDIRLEYFPYVNNTTKIIGHTHKTSQVGNIKLNESVDLAMDDSPRNSIAGTLFLGLTASLLQVRTELWARGGVSEARKVGDIATFEQLFWRRIPRTKVDGNFIGLVQSGVHASLLTVTRYAQLGVLNFVNGSMEIDYARDQCRGTLWEQYTDGEVDSDLAATYNFDYIYSTT